MFMRFAIRCCGDVWLIVCVVEWGVNVAIVQLRGKGGADSWLEQIVLTYCSLGSGYSLGRYG